MSKRPQETTVENDATEEVAEDELASWQAWTEIAYRSGRSPGTLAKRRAKQQRRSK